jgi:hypothetical protein
MRAAVFHGKGNISIENVEKPRPGPAKGEEPAIKIMIT